MERPKTRQLNIEIVRILAMLLIVGCHGMLHIHWLLNVDNAVSFNPGWKPAVEYTVVQYGQVGVSLFFIISGFFLVKKSFSWLRIFRTWFQMIIYTTLILIAISTCLKFISLPVSITSLLRGKSLINTLIWTFFPYSYGSYWFITAYMTLLVIIPFINLLFTNLSKKYIEYLIILLYIFCIWILFFGRVSPWNNVTYAMLGYLIGGRSRYYLTGTENSTKPIIHWIIILTSTLLMTVFNYVAADGSDFSKMMTWNEQVKSGVQALPIIIASSIFELSKGCKFDDKNKITKNIILKFASSTFGIYLIHENLFGYRILWPSLVNLFPIPHSPSQKLLLFLAIIIIAFIILAVISFLLDISIVHPLEKRTIQICNQLRRNRLKK